MVILSKSAVEIAYTRMFWRHKKDTMHFYYLDETGDTGTDLLNEEQPIFVMGGICISDEKWNPTQQKFTSIISAYFGGSIPNNFELHSHELLSPNGDGPFAGHTRANRNKLAFDILNILVDHSHHVHLISFCKRTLHATCCSLALPFDPKNPYLLGFDYLITQFNDHVKNRLGSSARGMLILDKKDQHHLDIERILYNRRFETVAAHRVKWIVEFSYPIDSTKNPMIQISDLVIFCMRKFLEVENGYAVGWSEPAKDFFANCYNIIEKRLTIKRDIVERSEPRLKLLNQHITSVLSKPALQWRKKYTLVP